MSTTQLQHAWYELTHDQTYSSLTIVPVEEGAQTLVLAQEIANVAARDPRQRVLVINATGTPAMRASSSQPVMPGRECFTENDVVPVAQGRFGLLDCARLKIDESLIGMVEAPRYIDDVRAGKSPFTMILVAANSPLSRPAAVSSARAADAVVLCVSLGTTSIRDAKRVVELVGEQNVAGSIAFSVK